MTKYSQDTALRDIANFLERGALKKDKRGSSFQHNGCRLYRIDGHLILYGAAVGELSAICTSGPYASSNEPGAFLLMVNDEVIAEYATRNVAFNHLRLGLT
ncbi:MAG: hypothetical protein KUG75_06465 [Pseudomonadales bacterium]|nr:hypothetical protein [Pseudomonadales bacterium]